VFIQYFSSLIGKEVRTKIILLCTFIISLLFFANYKNANAQTYSFDKIPTQEGEANLSVRQVIQDNNGFLWLATFSGLFRYEGDDYIIQQTFGDQNEINTDVTSLLQDEFNNIWVGTNNGLSKYNPATGKLITYFYSKDNPASIGSNKIRSLGKDKTGRILIGTFDAGLFAYDVGNDNFTKVNLTGSDILAPVHIRSILTEENGKVWIGTFNDGLYCFKLNGAETDSVYNFRADNPENHLSHNNVYYIFRDSDGTVVACTRDGLNIYNRATNSFEKIISAEKINANMANFYRTICRDKSGMLWIGTWGGLYVCKSFNDLENGNYELLTHGNSESKSISSGQVMNVFQDKSGTVWIGTEEGINRFDPYQNQFQALGGEIMNGLKEQTATDFSKWNDGILILTLSDGLLFKKDNIITKVFEKQLSSVANEKLYSLLVDSKKNIWAGSFNGHLVKIGANGQSVNIYKQRHENVPIYSIVEADNGLLLLATAGEGLKYFNPKTETFTVDNGLGGDMQTNEVFIDREKNIWLATQSGIFRKNTATNEINVYLPDNSERDLTPNIFIDIQENEKGEIIVGGRNGLYFFNSSSNTFVKKTFENMPELWVTNIRKDSKQNLWLNLNFNRMAKWDSETNELRIFYINNGIRTSAYNRRGFFMDENDELYVSGIDRIYRFKTSTQMVNKFSPPPVFTKLVINNSEIQAGMEMNKQVILDSNIQFQQHIKLNNRNKDFSLSFTSTSYLNSKENKYRYILSGYDKEWNIGNEKTAHYTNLNPGRYTFEVFSANNDGQWSENPSRLEIRIKPSPIFSVWAIIAYLLIAAVSAFQIRNTINARIQLRQELLIERVKREKEEKFHQERLRFYTNISHELRTPLTLIMGPIKQLIGGEKNSATITKLNHLILNNSQRLLSLVNQLLDFRKSVYEGMKLKATFSNIIETIESNIDAFDFMAKEKSITVRFTSESKVMEGWFDREKLDIILFNILSNAFKFNTENGFVEIGIKTDVAGNDISFKHIKLSVSNSGKGIPKHLQEKVFDRFYQVNNESVASNPGTGIGLSLVKTLVELHHGIITLESEPDKITTFIIYLPYEKTAYSDVEIFDFKRDADRRTKELVDNLSKKTGQQLKLTEKTDLQKILIVEDNSELREFLSDYLSADYQVITAANGFEGLSICESENPDLVISDIMMESMDGLQFCETIKSTPEISHIPVILMTALASVENKMTGYKVGADDYITKPFEPELLKIRAGNILENLKNARNGFAQNVHVSAKELTISKIDEDFMQQIIDLLEKNLDNSGFDIDSFCRNIGVSPSQLYRKIKSITGLSPNEFIRTYRLKKAAVLIRESNLNISEIAYQVGFNDALYFSKCFKKQFGTTPSLYGVHT
jgi:signal transduction histidine kinase/ligand-binding sensor domain-containing protein/DNA-binding response OmpR family regulator